MAIFNFGSLQEWFTNMLNSSVLSDGSQSVSNTSKTSALKTDDPFAHLFAESEIGDAWSISDTYSAYKNRLSKQNPDSNWDQLQADIQTLIQKKGGYTETELKFRRQAYVISPQSSAVESLTMELLGDGTLNTSMSVEELAQAISSYVNNTVEYQEELLNQDNWQDAHTTLSTGTGDCEDLAILTASLLMNALMKQGYSEADVRQMVTISAGTLNVNGVETGHTFVKFSTQPGADRSLFIDPTSGSNAVEASSVQFNELFECNDRIWKTYGEIDASFTTSYNIEGLGDYMAMLEDTYNQLYYASNQAEIDIWYYDYTSYIEDPDTAIRVYTEAELETMMEENEGILPEGINIKSKEQYEEEGLLTVARSVISTYEQIDGEWVKQDPVLDYFWTIETHELTFDTDDVPVTDDLVSESVVDYELTATGVSVSGADFEVTAEVTEGEPVELSDFFYLSNDFQTIWDDLVSLGYIDEDGLVQADMLDHPMLAEDFDSLGLDDTEPLVELLIAENILTDDMFVTAGLSGDDLTLAVEAATTGTEYEDQAESITTIINEHNLYNPLPNLDDSYYTSWVNDDGDTVTDADQILDVLREHMPTAELDGLPEDVADLPDPEDYEDDDTPSMPESETLDGDTLKFTTYLVNGDNLYNYINDSRKILNKFTSLFYVVMTLTEVHLFASREIQDEGLSAGAKQEASKFRQDADKVRKKLASNIATIQQKTGSGVQEIAQELTNLIQTKNKASYEQAKLDVELFANENIGAGIGSDLTDGFTHAISFVRSRVRAQVSALFSLAYTKNTVQFAELTKLYLDGPDNVDEDGNELEKTDTGIALWGDISESDVEYDRIANQNYKNGTLFFGKTIWDMLSPNASGETAFYSKKNILFLIDDLKNDANRLQAIVEQGLSRGTPTEKTDIYALSKGAVDTDEIETESGVITGATEFFEQSRDFDYTTDESTFLDIKLDMFERFRQGMVMFENNIRTALMIKQTLKERIYEETKKMTGKQETSGARMLNKIAEQALNVEISKMSGSFNTLYSQFNELYGSINDLAAARIEYHKAYKYVVAKNAKNAALLALLASATAAGSAIAPIFSVTGSYLALPTYWAYAINQMGAAIIESAYAGWEYNDLGLETPEWHRPYIMQEGDTSDGNIYNHLWTETYGKINEDELIEDGISSGDALTSISEDQKEYFANKMTEQLISARSQVNLLVNDSDTYGNFSLSYGQGDSNNSEIVPDTPYFITNRGDGGVSSEGVELAKTNAEYVEQMNKMRMFLAILKAYYDAIEGAITDMVGGSKRGSMGKFSNQLEAIVQKEQSIIGSIKQEISIFQQAAMQNYRKDKELYRQQYDASMTGVDIASSLLAFLPPGGRDAAILAKDLSVESIRMMVLENFGDYAGQWANYKRDEGAWSYNDFTNLYDSDSFMESRESELGRTDSDYELYSGTNIFDAETDAETGIVSDSTLVTVGENVIRQANESIASYSTEEKIDLATRYGPWLSLEYEEHAAMQNLLTKGTRLTYDDSLNFIELNYQQLIDTQEELMRISITRTILLMIEKSLYNAKLNEFKQMFGSASSNSIYESVMSVTDAYNNGQTALMGDLAQELSNKVEAHTTWYSSILSSSVSATGLVAFLGTALGQANSNSGNTFSMRKFFRDNQQDAQRAFAKGASSASSQAILGSMGMTTLRNTPTATSEILGYDEDEEIEEDDLEKQKEEIEAEIQANGGTATEAQTTQLNTINTRLSEISANRAERSQVNLGVQNVHFTGRGNMAINRGLLTRFQTELKQKLRFLKIQREVYIAQYDAALDATDEYGGKSSSRDHRKLLAILNKFNSTDKTVMDSLFKGVTNRATAFNQTMKFLKMGISAGATSVAQKIIGNKITQSKMALKKQKTDTPSLGNSPSDNSYTEAQRKAVRKVQMLEALSYVADPVVFLVFDTILNSATEKSFGPSATAEEDLSVSVEGVEFDEGSAEDSGGFDGSDEEASSSSKGFMSANVETALVAASIAAQNTNVRQKELFADRETFQFFKRYLEAKIITGFKIGDTQSEKFGTGFGRMFGNRQFNKLRRKKLMEYTSGKLDVNNDKALKAFNQSKFLTATHRKFAIKELGYDPTLSPEAQARKTMDKIGNYFRRKDAQRHFNAGLEAKQYDLMGLDRRLEYMDTHGSIDDTIKNLQQDTYFNKLKSDSTSLDPTDIGTGPADQILLELQALKQATGFSLGIYDQDTRADALTSLIKTHVPNTKHATQIAVVMNSLIKDYVDDKGFTKKFYKKETSEKLKTAFEESGALKILLKKTNEGRFENKKIDATFLLNQVHVLASTNIGTDELIRRHEQLTERLIDAGVSRQFLSKVEAQVPSQKIEQDSLQKPTGTKLTAQEILDHKAKQPTAELTEDQVEELRPHDFLSHYFNHAGLGMNRLMAKKRSLDLIGASVEATRTYKLDNYGAQVQISNEERKKYKEYVNELSKRLDHFGGFSLHLGQYIETVQKNAGTASSLTKDTLSDDYHSLHISFKELQKRLIKGTYTTGRDLDKKGSHHYLDEVTDMASDPDKYGINLHSGSEARQLDKNPFDNFMGGLAGVTLAGLAIIPSIFALIAGMFTGFGATKLSRKILRFSGTVYRDAFETGFRVSDGARRVRLFGKSNKDMDPILRRETRHALQAERRGILRQTAANTLVESVYLSGRNGEAGKALRINKHRGTELAGKIDGAYKSDFKGKIDGEAGYYLAIEQAGSAIIHRKTGSLGDKAEIFVQMLDRIKDPKRASEIGAQILQKAATIDLDSAKELADAIVDTAKIWDDKIGTNKHKTMAAKSLLLASSFDERVHFNYINKKIKVDGRSAHQNYQRNKKGPTLAGFASTALGRGEAILKGLGVTRKKVEHRQDMGRHLLASLNIKSLESMSEHISGADLQSGALRHALSPENIETVATEIKNIRYNAHEQAAKLEAIAMLYKKSDHSSQLDVPEPLAPHLETLGSKTEDLANMFKILNESNANELKSTEIIKPDDTLPQLSKRLKTDTYSDKIELHFSGLGGRTGLMRRRLNTLGVEVVKNNASHIAAAMIKAQTVEELQEFLGLFDTLDSKSTNPTSADQSDSTPLIKGFQKEAVQTISEALSMYTDDDLQHLKLLLGQSIALSTEDEHTGQLLLNALDQQDTKLENLLKYQSTHKKHGQYKAQDLRFNQALNQLKKLDDRHFYLFLEDANNLSQVAGALGKGLTRESQLAAQSVNYIARRLKNTSSLQFRLAESLAKHFAEQQHYMMAGYKKINIDDIKNQLMEQAKLQQQSQDLATFLSKFDYAYRAQQYMPSLYAFFNTTSGPDERRKIITDYAKTYGVDAAGDFMQKAATKDPKSMALLLSDLNHINPNLANALAEQVTYHMSKQSTEAELNTMKDFYTHLAQEGMKHMAYLPLTVLPASVLRRLGRDKLQGKDILDLDDLIFIQDALHTAETRGPLSPAEQRILGFTNLILHARDGYGSAEKYMENIFANANQLKSTVNTELATKMTTLLTHAQAFNATPLPDGSTSFSPTFTTKQHIKKNLKKQWKAAENVVFRKLSETSHSPTALFGSKQETLTQIYNSLQALYRATASQTVNCCELPMVEDAMKTLDENLHHLPKDLQQSLEHGLKLMPLLTGDVDQDAVSRILKKTLIAAPSSMVVEMLCHGNSKAMIENVLASDPNSNETIQLVQQFQLILQSDPDTLTNLVSQRKIQQEALNITYKDVKSPIERSMLEIAVTDEHMEQLGASKIGDINNQATQHVHIAMSRLKSHIVGIALTASHAIRGLCEDSTHMDEKTKQDLKTIIDAQKETVQQVIEDVQTRRKTDPNIQGNPHHLIAYQDLIITNTLLGNGDFSTDNWQAADRKPIFDMMVNEWKATLALEVNPKHKSFTTLDKATTIQDIHTALEQASTVINKSIKTLTAKLDASESSAKSAKIQDLKNTIGRRTLLLNQMSTYLSAGASASVNSELRKLFGFDDPETGCLNGGVSLDAGELALTIPQQKALSDHCSDKNKQQFLEGLSLYKKTNPKAYFRLLASIAIKQDHPDLQNIKSTLHEADPDTFSAMLASPRLFSSVALANSTNSSQGFDTFVNIEAAMDALFANPALIPGAAASSLQQNKIEQLRALNLNMDGLKQLMLQGKDYITSESVNKIKQWVNQLQAKDIASGLAPALKQMVNTFEGASNDYLKNIVNLSYKVKKHSLKETDYTQQLNHIYGLLHTHTDKLREFGIKETEIEKLTDSFSGSTDQLLATYQVLDGIKEKVVETGVSHRRPLNSEENAITKYLENSKKFLASAIVYELIGNEDTSIENLTDRIQSFLNIIQKDTSPHGPFSMSLASLFQNNNHIKKWFALVEHAKPEQRDAALAIIFKQANIFGKDDISVNRCIKCLDGLAQQPKAMADLLNMIPDDDHSVHIIDRMLQDDETKHAGLLAIAFSEHPNIFWERGNLTHLSAQDLAALYLNLKGTKKTDLHGYLYLHRPEIASDVMAITTAFDMMDKTSVAAAIPNTGAWAGPIGGDTPNNAERDLQHIKTEFERETADLGTPTQNPAALKAAVNKAVDNIEKIRNAYVGKPEETSVFDGIHQMPEVIKKECLDRIYRNLAMPSQLETSQHYIAKNLEHGYTDLLEKTMLNIVNTTPELADQAMQTLLNHPQIRPYVGAVIESCGLENQLLSQSSTAKLEIDTLVTLIQAPNTSSIRRKATASKSSGLTESINLKLAHLNILDASGTYAHHFQSKSHLRSRLAETEWFYTSEIDQILTDWEKGVQSLPFPLLIEKIAHAPSIFESITSSQAESIIQHFYEQDDLKIIAPFLLHHGETIRNILSIESAEVASTSGQPAFAPWYRLMPTPATKNICYSLLNACGNHPESLQQFTVHALNTLDAIEEPSLKSRAIENFITETIGNPTFLNDARNRGTTMDMLIRTVGHANFEQPETKDTVIKTFIKLANAPTTVGKHQAAPAGQTVLKSTKVSLAKFLVSNSAGTAAQSPTRTGPSSVETTPLLIESSRPHPESDQQSPSLSARTLLMALDHMGYLPNQIMAYQPIINAPKNREVVTKRLLKIATNNPNMFNKIRNHPAFQNIIDSIIEGEGHQLNQYKLKTMGTGGQISTDALNQDMLLLQSYIQNDVLKSPYKNEIMNFFNSHSPRDFALTWQFHMMEMKVLLPATPSVSELSLPAVPSPQLQLAHGTTPDDIFHSLLTTVLELSGLPYQGLSIAELKHVMQPDEWAIANDLFSKIKTMPQTRALFTAIDRQEQLTAQIQHIDTLKTHVPRHVSTQQAFDALTTQSLNCIKVSYIENKIISGLENIGIRRDHVSKNQILVDNNVANFAQHLFDENLLDTHGRLHPKFLLENGNIDTPALKSAITDLLNISNHPHKTSILDQIIRDIKVPIFATTLTSCLVSGLDTEPSVVKEMAESLIYRDGSLSQNQIKQIQSMLKPALKIMTTSDKAIMNNPGAWTLENTDFNSFFSVLFNVCNQSQACLKQPDTSIRRQELTGISVLLETLKKSSEAETVLTHFPWLNRPYQTCIAETKHTPIITSNAVLSELQKPAHERNLYKLDAELGDTYANRHMRIQVLQGLAYGGIDTVKTPKLSWESKEAIDCLMHAKDRSSQNRFDQLMVGADNGSSKTDWNMMDEVSPSSMSDLDVQEDLAKQTIISNLWRECMDLDLSDISKSPASFAKKIEFIAPYLEENRLTELMNKYVRSIDDWSEGHAELANRIATSHTLKNIKLQGKDLRFELLSAMMKAQNGKFQIDILSELKETLFTSDDLFSKLMHESLSTNKDRYLTKRSEERQFLKALIFDDLHTESANSPVHFLLNPSIIQANTRDVVTSALHSVMKAHEKGTVVRRRRMERYQERFFHMFDASVQSGHAMPMSVFASIIGKYNKSSHNLTWFLKRVANSHAIEPKQLKKMSVAQQLGHLLDLPVKNNKLDSATLAKQHADPAQRRENPLPNHQLNLTKAADILATNKCIVDGSLQYPLPATIDDMDWGETNFLKETKEWVLKELKRLENHQKNMLEALNKFAPHVLYRFDNRVQRAKHSSKTESATDPYHNPYASDAAVGVHQADHYALIPFLHKTKASNQLSIEAQLVSIMRDRQKISAIKFKTKASAYGKPDLIPMDLAQSIYNKLIKSDVVDSDGIVIPRRVKATYLTRLLKKIDIKDPFTGQTTRTVNMTARQINKVKGALHDLLEDSFAIKDRVSSRSHSEHLAYLQNPRVPINEKAFYIRTLLLKPLADATSYSVSDRHQKRISKALVAELYLRAKKSLEQQTETSAENINMYKELLALFYVEDRTNVMQWLQTIAEPDTLEALGLGCMEPKLTRVEAPDSNRWAKPVLLDPVADTAKNILYILQENRDTEGMINALRWYLILNNTPTLELALALNLLVKQGAISDDMIKNVVSVYETYPELITSEVLGFNRKYIDDLNDPEKMTTETKAKLKAAISFDTDLTNMGIGCRLPETEKFFVPIQKIKQSVIKEFKSKYETEKSLAQCTESKTCSNILDIISKLKPVTPAAPVKSTKKQSLPAAESHTISAAKRAHTTYRQDGHFVNFVQRLVDLCHGEGSATFSAPSHAVVRNNDDYTQNMENIEWMPGFNYVPSNQPETVETH